jgi:hypothetical protein
LLSKRQTDFGVVGEKAPRREASGKLTSIASSIQGTLFDREVLMDHAQARQECLCEGG